MRVFIIHGWEGFPEEGWFPWLKKEAKDFDVQVPAMPDTEEPKIKPWVSKIQEIVGKPDEDTYFVGHSIGCQAILRYLQTLPEGTKVGGVIMVAGWVNLTREALEEEEDSEAIAKPWIETPINWDAIKATTSNIVAIFSDNDPHVPIDDAKIFKEKLNAKIILEHKKGHFSGSDNITELPVVLDELRKFTQV